jgi:HPt (histidine-containing phosphotransfer) domain-containing protein
MQQLRAQYRQTVTGDIRGLQQQAADLCGDEQDRATLERMVEVLHRIAGGAGVFGLPQLSEQARMLELDMLERMAVPLAERYRDILPDIRSVLAALARAAA